MSPREITKLEQNNSHEVRQIETELERGEQNEVECVRQRSAPSMEIITNSYHYHNSSNPPTDISNYSKVQPDHICYLDKHKTPPASSDTSQEFSTSPRETSCTNCQHLEGKLEELYKFIQFLQNNFCKQTDIYNSLLSTSHRESIRKETKLREIIRCYSIDEQQKMGIIPEEKREKEFQKLKKEREIVDYERDEAEQEKDKLVEHLHELSLCGKSTPDIIATSQRYQLIR